MARSFQLKLAFLSALFSGLVLLAFATFFLVTLARTGIGRIDRELQALAEAPLRRAQPPGHWQRFDTSLASLRGLRRPGLFVLKVNAPDGNPLYRSTGWPAGVTAAQLGMPEIAGREPPARPPPRTDRDTANEPPPELPVDAPRFATVSSGAKSWRFTVMANREVVLALGMDLNDFHADVQRALRIFAVAAPIALLLLALAGWALARHALRPVNVLTQVAAEITAKGLDRRVAATGADREFQALVDVINRMLDRLERSFGQATRFSADAAHELRTPLTILQGELESHLQAAPAGSDEQRRYGGLLDEVQRLKSIVQKLLLLARADAGRLPIDRATVNLSEQIASLCEDAAILGPNLVIRRELATDVRIEADSALLMQALRNLVDNAVKYNVDGGLIEIRLEVAGSHALTTIRNTVRPDAVLDPARIFDRFYRGDPAHGRQVDGAGLGLSLAREIARAHGGDLEFGGLRDGVVEFRLTLPRGAAPG